MRATIRLAAISAAALVAVGGKGGDTAGALTGFGVAVALVVLLGLPLGLLLHLNRPAWIASAARAAERRTTASALVGAALLLAALFVFNVAKPRAPWIAVAVVAASAAWFYAGFAGCALQQGRRLLGEGTAGPVKVLVLGWLARAGLFAVPVLWPFLGAYLVVLAFGAPLVAVFEGKDSPAAT